MMTLPHANHCASNRITLNDRFIMRVQFKNCYNFFAYNQNQSLKVSFDSDLYGKHQLSVIKVFLNNK